MSYEYSASAALTTAEVHQLKASLPNANYVLISAPSPSQLLLRFGDRPARKEWAEDIDICFGDVVHVAIHSGTDTQRVDFLQHFEAQLTELGYVCHFEED